LHSDHGSQYTSWSFTANLKHHQLLGSMGTIGDCLFTGYYDWMESKRSLRKWQDLAA